MNLPTNKCYLRVLMGIFNIVPHDYHKWPWTTLQLKCQISGLSICHCNLTNKNSKVKKWKIRRKKIDAWTKHGM